MKEAANRDLKNELKKKMKLVDNFIKILLAGNESQRDTITKLSVIQRHVLSAQKALESEEDVQMAHAIRNLTLIIADLHN